jgi:four helix bundle protein
MLNIAEGTGKRTGPDKRNYYSIARGSVFENVAILDLLSELSILSKNDFDLYYEKLEEISKMLYAMIKAIK